MTGDGAPRQQDDGPGDASLWLEAISGTEASFAALFHRHRARVFRKAYSRIQNVTDAEDIVAVVFLEAWRNRRKVRIVDGSILPWLLSVTTYVSLNTSRSTRRYRRLINDLPAPSDQDDGTDAIDCRIDGLRVTAAVATAMASLKPNDQIILDLCILEELSLATVASVLDIPVGTVKSRLHRAREKMRRKLMDAPDIRDHPPYFAGLDGPVL